MKYFRYDVPEFLAVVKISESCTFGAVTLVFFNIAFSNRAGGKLLFSTGATGAFALFEGAAIRANNSAVGYFHHRYSSVN